jgi:hypothetical protein
MVEQKAILQKPRHAHETIHDRIPDFPLGKAELRRVLKLLSAVARSAEVKAAARHTHPFDQQWNAFVRREMRAQGMTVKDLEDETGEAIRAWGNPTINKLMNIIQTLGYDLIAVPRDYTVELRVTQGAEKQTEQLRACFLGAPNQILTREYLSSILWPWESYRDQRDYKGVDVVITKMRKEFPELMEEVKTHWHGGWEWTPDVKQEKPKPSGRGGAGVQG